jgi:cell shape-determining protein MreC
MRVRSRRSSSRRRLVQIVVGFGVLVLLALVLPKAFSVLSSAVMKPFHSFSSWLEESSSLVPSFIRSRKDLTEQITSLEHDLFVAGGRDLTTQHLLAENAQLRALLGITNEERIAAAIIARPNELPYDLLQIDRGASHGVTTGAPVFVGRDIVIGLVVHVTSDYSFVELITTPDFEATAFVSGPNIVVPLEGYGGGVARVRVPQGIVITVGDLVHLPSVNPGVFGRISHIENEPTQPEQYGYITPEVSLSGLQYVAVGQQSQIAADVSVVDANIREIIESTLTVSGVTAAMVATTSSSTATTTNQIE